MSYYSPKIKRGYTIQLESTSRKENQPGLYSSTVKVNTVKVNQLRKTFNELIDEVSQKRDNSVKAVTEVQKTNQDLRFDLQNAQNEDYIEQLEEDNIAMKKKLNQEIKRNLELIRNIDEMEEKSWDKNTIGSNKDLQLENKALKVRLLKLNEDYNKLYDELQVLKSSNQKLRKQTVSLLAKK